ncbi:MULTISPECIES: DUF624 domain-containing protein [Enterococcus]|jgi:hypothetical protein|uniref:DUF624 domain-containing protein n=1 Tax=Enterococcus TaxID=1350 RepID=UPI000A32FE3E|nr:MULTISPECIES: DUF624 domain-containing protein [unclassified Enterococcus]AUJ84242.1 DUF624 domain-containing protein [Enterococcus sp. CR-Ec1]MBO1120616.1 DUF624 domain-containing protein [Enterococcus casseliflavus]OTO30971.1 hypothetical protein A5876_001582 [Enterococcus sp. 3C8_DIV0646]UOO45931.1 DUF624 domain-containing protein [Enterococcus casseliflavus]
MNRLFSYEGWYYRVFAFLADMIIVSFLFMIPAMTLILAGPALIALYRTIDQLYKERDVPIWQRYKQAVLSNLKRGLFLEGLVIAYVAVFAGLIYSLMMLTPYFGVLAVILVSLAALYLVVFVLLYSLFAQSLQETAKETAYAVLSSTANAIILLVIPIIVFVLCSKVNLFLFVCLGISGSAFVQVLFFNKVLAKGEETND